jgi:hypothetical protein
LGKLFDAAKALLRFLCQRPHNDSFDFGREIRHFFSQWLDGNEHLLARHLRKRAVKGPCAAQPLVDHNAQ